ncbi:MAG: HlyC/CorC family transporter [Verrucomicrobia bacterium]|nr:HlyC/CorC family transporter [Verrucomicrobiota bacterium]
MLSVPLELTIIALLLLANGVLAMAEIAVVSARKTRLKKLAAKGDVRAQIAYAIAEEPTRFLSTVQVGITLVGVLAGAFGGRTMAENFERQIAEWPALAPHAEALGLAIVVSGITVASVILGELVPKRLGLHAPERVAVLLARPINWLSHIVAPVAAGLTFVTDRTLRLVGIGQPKEAPVTEEEVRNLVEQGVETGAFNPAEQRLVESVLTLDQRPVTLLMTPRPKIVFLNLDDPEEVNWRRIVASGHSYFPVYQNHRDQIVGMVAVKALWAHSAIGLPTTLKNLLVPPLLVSEKMTAIQLLEQFKKTGKHIAVVTDEFGAVQGLVTLIDVMEAIVGDLPERGGREQPEAKRRDDGSWLVDATMPTGELKTLLALDAPLPHEGAADFQTLGGFVVTQFGRIPAAGDWFEWGGWRFEVVDMDKRRVDKVLIAKAATGAAERKKAG